jgi:hypothetical protein
MGQAEADRRGPVALGAAQGGVAGGVTLLRLRRIVRLLHFPGERLVFCRQFEQRHTDLLIGDAAGDPPVTIGTDEQVGDIHERPNGIRRPQFEQAAEFDPSDGLGGETSVPESWDPARYRERAHAWRENAMTLPEDHPERAVCIELADG